MGLLKTSPNQQTNGFIHFKLKKHLKSKTINGWSKQQNRNPKPKSNSSHSRLSQVTLSPLTLSPPTQPAAAPLAHHTATVSRQPAHRSSSLLSSLPQLVVSAVAVRHLSQPLSSRRWVLLTLFLLFYCSLNYVTDNLLWR